MAKETERKFLLKDDSWRNLVISSAFFCQGYIPVLPDQKGHITVRIRLAEGKGFLTLKNAPSASTSFSRDEFEYAIPEDDAKIMLEKFCGEKVEKTRHIVLYGGNKWEIDEFSGKNAGLILAEIELSSEDMYFERPPFLGKEVTFDHSYSNSALAVSPYCSRQKKQEMREDLSSEKQKKEREEK